MFKGATSFSFSLLFLLVPLMACSQHDFRSGYVVLAAGDTLRGEIDYRNDTQMSSHCTFRRSPTEEKKEYSPDQLLSFRFDNSKYYVSRKVPTKSGEKRVFLEFLIKGKLSVYYFEDETWGHYLIEKEGQKLMELPYEERVVKDSDGRSYVRKTVKHQGILLYTMSDAPAMVPKINAMAPPDHSNLIKLAKTYHEMVCQDQSCIVYEKKAPSVGIHPEALVGMAQYRNSEIVDGGYFVGGILLHVWLPRASERLFFKTGVSYVSLSTAHQKNINTYKVPLQLEYMFPKTIIRPYLAYGLNFYLPYYSDFSTTLSISAGVRIPLYKSVHLSIGTDVEFTPKEPYLIVPDRLLSYSLLSGVYFNF